MFLPCRSVNLLTNRFQLFAITVRQEGIQGKFAIKCSTCKWYDMWYSIYMSQSPIPAEEMMPFGRKEATPPPAEYILGPNEQVQVDTDLPLADSGDMRHKFGIEGNLVASVNAGSKSFLIVDVRDTDNNRDFYVIDETFSSRKRHGFKGILKHIPVIIGRGHSTDRFSYPSTVSRDHFEVAYENEGLFVRNLNPTNKTVITANLVFEARQPQFRLPHHLVKDVRTERAEERMQQHPNFGEKDDTAPYGYYMNHPILGRHSTSVDGGVYLGGLAREAIVVDGKSEAVRRVYDEAASELQGAFRRNETMPLRAILLKVMHKVQEVMPYDGPKTERISQEHYGDKLVGLSTFLKERAGVCRHQGLLAAYMIERLIKDGHMMGAVGVERNTVEDMGGTHAWAVYKTRQNGSEEVIVVDPAQSFVGTKAQAQREGRWEYRLSTDKYV